MPTPLRPFVAAAITAGAIVVAVSAWIAQSVPAPPTPRPARNADVMLLGSSLSVDLEKPLATALRRRGKNLASDSRPGLHLADLFAGALRASDNGARTILIELNAFFVNERVHLAATRPDRIVTLRPTNSLHVWPEVSWRVRYALLRQGIVEEALEEQLRRHFPPYARSGTWRTRVELDPEAARPEVVRTVVGKNFGRKDYANGVDTHVLRDLLDWIAREQATPAGARILLYLPPYSRAYLREVTGSERAWNDHRSWRTTLASDARERAIALLDYSERFVDRPELFVDYGHSKRPAFHRTLAEELAKDVTGR